MLCSFPIEQKLDDSHLIQADLMEVSINKEYDKLSHQLTTFSLDMDTYRCEELRRKIEHLAEGEYSFAKRDVDRLRAELGQPPVPSLQATLEEKRSQYVIFLFFFSPAAHGPFPHISQFVLSDLVTHTRPRYLFERRMNGTENSMACIKRNGMESSTESSNPSGKRPRGRPKGSKNRAKNVATSDAPPASSS